MGSIGKHDLKRKEVNDRMKENKKKAAGYALRPDTIEAIRNGSKDHHISASRYPQQILDHHFSVKEHDHGNGSNSTEER